MTQQPSSDDQSLLISSVPLGWRHVTVEVRLYRRHDVIDRPGGDREHGVMIWDHPTTCTLVMAGIPMQLSHLQAPVVVVPARTSFRSIAKAQTRFTKLRIEDAFVSRIGRDALGVSGFTLQAAAVDGDQDLRAIAYLLSQAVTGHQPLDAAMVAVMAREAAIHLISTYSDIRRPRRDLAGRIASAKLVRILDYLAANLHRPLPVAELAREAGLSPAHFSRAFAKSTGRAPHAYVMARRIAKAQHLLRNSSASIDQIAAQCGFHDQAHLARLFKRSTGQTPGSFRADRP